MLGLPPVLGIQSSLDICNNPPMMGLLGTGGDVIDVDAGDGALGGIVPTDAGGVVELLPFGVDMKPKVDILHKLHLA